MLFFLILIYGIINSQVCRGPIIDFTFDHNCTGQELIIERRSTKDAYLYYTCPNEGCYDTWNCTQFYCKLQTGISCNYGHLLTEECCDLQFQQRQYFVTIFFKPICNSGDDWETKFYNMIISGNDTGNIVIGDSQSFEKIFSNVYTHSCNLSEIYSISYTVDYSNLCSLVAHFWFNGVYIGNITEDDNFDLKFIYGNYFYKMISFSDKGANEEYYRLLVWDIIPSNNADIIALQEYGKNASLCHEMCWGGEEEVPCAVDNYWKNKAWVFIGILIAISAICCLGFIIGTALGLVSINLSDEDWRMMGTRSKFPTQTKNPIVKINLNRLNPKSYVKMPQDQY